MRQLSVLDIENLLTSRLDKDATKPQMEILDMGEIIDFKTKEMELRHKRIQELTEKALTSLLDEDDMEELRELTKNGCH